MSGTGAAVAPRMMSATVAFCPTRGCEPAVEAERSAAVDHIRAKIETAKRKGCDAHLVRVLDELAEDIVRGLHRS